MMVMAPISVVFPIRRDWPNWLHMVCMSPSGIKMNLADQIQNKLQSLLSNAISLCYFKIEKERKAQRFYVHMSSIQKFKTWVPPQSEERCKGRWSKSRFRAQKPAIQEMTIDYLSWLIVQTAEPRINLIWNVSNVPNFNLWSSGTVPLHLSQFFTRWKTEPADCRAAKSDLCFSPVTPPSLGQTYTQTPPKSKKVKL